MNKYRNTYCYWAHKIWGWLQCEFSYITTRGWVFIFLGFIDNYIRLVMCLLPIEKRLAFRKARKYKQNMPPEEENKNTLAWHIKYSRKQQVYLRSWRPHTYKRNLSQIEIKNNLQKLTRNIRTQNVNPKNGKEGNQH